MRAVSLFLAALAFVACGHESGPDEADEVEVSTGALTAGLTATVKTHLGVEKRLPASALPVRSPIKVDQRRWDDLRAGRDWPRSRDERTALGMGIQFCSNCEACDAVANCDGIDTDGVQSDGIDETEHIRWNQNQMGSGWNVCDNGNNWGCFAGGVTTPIRCDHKGGAGRYYTYYIGVGQPTSSTMVTGDIRIFQDNNFAGRCAGTNQTGFAAVSDMNNVAPNLSNSMSSFRYGGSSSAPHKIEFWDCQNYASFCLPADGGSAWTSSAPVEFSNVGTQFGTDNDANSFKVDH